MTTPTDVRQPALRMTWEEDNLVLSLAPLQPLDGEAISPADNQTRRLIEFTDGFVEVLPVATETHQVMLRCVFLALYTYP